MTKSRFKGLNDHFLTAKAKKLMPKGARLLESEEERMAFQKELMEHKDLWIRYALYCTTRRRGWYKISHRLCCGTSSEDRHADNCLSFRRAG